MCVLEAGTRIMGKTGNVKVKASVFATNYRLQATICDERAQTPPPSPTLRRKFFRRFSPQNPGFCSFCSARGGSAAGGDGGFAAAGRRTKDSALRAEGRSAPPSLWGGEAATAHLGRAASAASDAGSPWVGRPESIQSKGAPTALRAVGNKEMVPPGGTREKSSGVTMPSAPPEAKKHPRHPHRARGNRPRKASLVDREVPTQWAEGLSRGLPLASGVSPRRGSVFTSLCGGPGGVSSSGRALWLHSPWRVLSWTAPAACSLFARKENGGL